MVYMSLPPTKIGGSCDELIGTDRSYPGCSCNLLHSEDPFSSLVLRRQKLGFSSLEAVPGKGSCSLK